MAKQLGKGEGLFQFAVPYHRPSLTEVRAGANAEARAECYLLTCSPWLAQPPFLLNSGPPAQG